MKQDDLTAALTRLLEPTTVELADEDAIMPYWAMAPDARGAAPASAVGAEFAPDLARFLSDGFASERTSPAPSLADIAAYVDGLLDDPEREAFEAALVASPELRAEVDMLFDRVAAFGAEVDDGAVTPASGIGGSPRTRGLPRSEP